MSDEVADGEATVIFAQSSEGVGFTNLDLEQQTLVALKSMAKNHKISGYSTMNKTQLIAALKEMANSDTTDNIGAGS